MTPSEIEALARRLVAAQTASEAERRACWQALAGLPRPDRDAVAAAVRRLGGEAG
jgi:hypothetical protein